MKSWRKGEGKGKRRKGKTASHAAVIQVNIYLVRTQKFQKN